MSYTRIAGCCLALIAAACFPDRQTPRQQSDTSADSAFVDGSEPDGNAPKSRNGSRRATSSKASDEVVNADTAVIAVALNDSAGPLTVAGHGFTLLFQKERFGDLEHVRYLQIRDDDGVVQHEERFDPPLRGSEPEWTTTIRAYALRGSHGQGLVLYYREGSGPSRTATSMRMFGMRSGRLHAIAPRIAVNGRFAPLQESREPHVQFLLPGERFDVEVWQDHFRIVVPFEVRLASCTPQRQPCIRAAVRRGDIVPGLSILPVIVNTREITADTSVVLFDAPEGKNASRFPVLRTSKINVMDAAAEVFNEVQDGMNVIRTRREWLRVRINGREGWIHGADSFGAIGLSPT